VIKFVSDLRQVGGFLRVSSIYKADRHDITEILLKVALNNIHLTLLLLTNSIVHTVNLDTSGISILHNRNHNNCNNNKQSKTYVKVILSI